MKVLIFWSGLFLNNWWRQLNWWLLGGIDNEGYWMLDPKNFLIKDWRLLCDCPITLFIRLTHYWHPTCWITSINHFTKTVVQLKLFDIVSSACRVTDVSFTSLAKSLTNHTGNQRGVWHNRITTYQQDFPCGMRIETSARGAGDKLILFMSWLNQNGWRRQGFVVFFL